MYRAFVASDEMHNVMIAATLEIVPNVSSIWSIPTAVNNSDSWRCAKECAEALWESTKESDIVQPTSPEILKQLEYLVFQNHNSTHF